MKLSPPLALCLMAILMVSCDNNTSETAVQPRRNPLVGTWKLISATLVEKGDTTTTDYTKERSFIKIINETHFAFLNHDLNRDSTAVFGAGGGTYSLSDSTYTEHLEYCNARNWEGNDFTFNVVITGDTLVQSGVEKIESEGIERMNSEKYVRLNP